MAGPLPWRPAGGADTARVTRKELHITAEAVTGCRVLICDDVEDYRALLVELLHRLPGLSVVGQAENGLEAVEVAGTQQPDLVLLDVSMPVMDGMEALPLIRSAAPNTKVLVLTGFASPSIRAQALAAGAVGYIEKGTPIVALLEAVRSACADN